MPKNKLRIAFFGDDFARRGRGTALFVQKIATELVQHHSDTIDITLLRPVGICRGEICSRVRHVLIPRRFSTLLSYLWFFIVHRGNYDVVVFNRVVYPGFWFLRAKKFIILVYDASISEIYSVPRTGVNLFFELFLKYVGRHFIDAAMAISKDAQKWIAQYYLFLREQIHIIYPGAESYRVLGEQERADARIDIKDTYGISSPYILSVSRFDPHKNIERILDAFFILKRNEHTPHALVLIGGRHTPGYSDRIIKKIEDSEFRTDIHVLNYVEEEDMSALYNCAGMLVFPSLVEGFGLPVIEAMKCGTPVITSNISSLPEIAGGAALLVDPMNVEAIADAMWQLTSDKELRDDLVARGLKRAAEFTWSRSAGEFLQII